MKRKNKLPSNMEIEEIDSENFRLLFFGDGETYVSEVYWRMPDESLDDAAMSICRRFGWVDNPPNNNYLD
jgi:hypothetical protein